MTKDEVLQLEDGDLVRDIRDGAEFFVIVSRRSGIFLSSADKSNVFARMSNYEYEYLNKVDAPLEPTYPDKIIKAGRCVTFDHGAYSDRQVLGFFVALEDINIDKEIDEFPVDVTLGYETFDYRQFILHLIKKGWLMEIVHDQVCLGGYDQKPDRRDR